MINLFKNLFNIGVVAKDDPDFLKVSNEALRKALTHEETRNAVLNERIKNLSKRVKSLKRNVDRLKKK
jgi:ubiquinone biosynthesis protein UbiJ|tara:strand:- start:1482 stop:1685 length:204 start_codon:yes stop_codon:yes gene_type:complete